MKSVLLSILIILMISTHISADVSDWEGGRPDKCTTIMVGKKASNDGSVMTSHTCDSHRTPSWMDIQPARKYKEGSEVIRCVAHWNLRIRQEVDLFPFLSPYYSRAQEVRSA